MQFFRLCCGLLVCLFCYTRYSLFDLRLIDFGLAVAMLFLVVRVVVLATETCDDMVVIVRLIDA